MGKKIWWIYTFFPVAFPVTAEKKDKWKLTFTWFLSFYHFYKLYSIKLKGGSLIGSSHTKSRGGSWYSSFTGGLSSFQGSYYDDMSITPSICNTGLITLLWFVNYSSRVICCFGCKRSSSLISTNLYLNFFRIVSRVFPFPEFTLFPIS